MKFTLILARSLTVTLLLLTSLVCGASNSIEQQTSMVEGLARLAPGVERSALALALDAEALAAMDQALGEAYNSPRDQEDLIALAQQAHISSIYLYGDTDPRAIASQYDLARVYTRMGRQSPAKHHIKQSYDQVLQFHPGGRLHGRIATSMALAFQNNGAAFTTPLLDLAEEILILHGGATSLQMARLVDVRKELEMGFGVFSKAAEHAGRVVKILGDLPDTDEKYLRWSKIDAEMMRLIGSNRFTLVELLTNFDDIYEPWLMADPAEHVRCLSERLQVTRWPLQPLVLQTCDGGLTELDRQKLIFHMGMAVGVTGNFEILDKYEGLYEQHFSSPLPSEVDLLRLITKGQYAKALNLLKVFGGAVVAINGEYHPRAAEYLSQLASVHRWLGEGEEAARLSRLALGIYVREAPTDLVSISGLMIKLGIYAARTGDYQDAERYFAASEKLIDQQPVPESNLSAGSEEMSLAAAVLDIRPSQTERAYLYLALGKFDDARVILESDLATKQAQRGEGLALVSPKTALIDFYESLNDQGRAATLIREVIGSFSPIFLQEYPVIEVELLLARLARMEGSYVLARSHLRRAITLSGDLASSHLRFSNIYRDLAVLEMADGRYAEALVALQQLLDHPFIAGNLQKSALIRVEMGQALLALGQTRVAVATIEEALIDLTVYGNAMTLWNAEAVMSSALYQQKNLGGAIYFGKLAVNHLQEIRAGLTNFSQPLQTSFLGDKNHAYRTLANALIEVGELGQAQAVMAMLKQHEYANFITRGDQALNDAAAILLFNSREEKTTNDYTATSSSLASLNQQIRVLQRRSRDGSISSDEQKQLKSLKRSANKERKAFRNEIRAIQKEFANLSTDRIVELGEKNLDSLGAMQGSIKRLGPDVALVHFLVLPEKVRMIVTTGAQQISLVSNMDQAELNRLIFNWRASIDDIDDDVDELGLELYRLLFEPLEATLQADQVSTVMVSLDGVLRYLPFAALHDGKGYLAQRYQFSLFTPAARTSMERKPQANWSVAAFGVSKSFNNFAALPEVPLELNNIVSQEADDAGVLPGLVVLDEQFTNDRFSEVLNADNRYPVVHIASHFDFVPGRESDSFLLTASGGLSVDDIQFGDYPMQDVELLTLSACNSGLSGIGADGAEIEGLATLAQNKGVAAVIATLWPVADASTGQFMSDFYRIHTARGVSKAAALQETQRLFIEGDSASVYGHPYFWAPFILMGNWL